MSRKYKKIERKKSDYEILRDLFRSHKYEQYIKESTKYLQYGLDSKKEVIFMRAKSYRALNKFDEAIYDLKTILNKDKKNGYALAELFYIYYYLNMYEEALKMLPIMYETRCINAYSVAIAELVMKKSLGLSYKVKNGDKDDYIKKQIVNYDKDGAIEHVIQHTKHSEETSKFNSNLDVNYLFDIVRSNIDSNNKLNISEILEVHCFAISSVGVFMGDSCNYLRVVVVPNTNNIISMYPTITAPKDYITNIDINYSKLFKEEEKVKKMSQIDRFNKRYGRV